MDPELKLTILKKENRSKCICFTHTMNTCWQDRGGIAQLGMSNLQGETGLTYSGGSAKLHKPGLPVKLQCNTSCLPHFIRSTPVSL